MMKTISAIITTPILVIIILIMLIVIVVGYNSVANVVHNAFADIKYSIIAGATAIYTLMFAGADESAHGNASTSTSTHTAHNINAYEGGGGGVDILESSPLEIGAYEGGDGYSSGGNDISKELEDIYENLHNEFSDNDSSAEIIVGFHYADWCGYCKEMKPVWKELEEIVGKDSNIKLLQINEEKTRHPVITKIPMIIKYNASKNDADTTSEKPKISIYEGKPDAKKILKWIRE